MGNLRGIISFIGAVSFCFCASARASEKLEFGAVIEPHKSAKIRDFFQWSAVEIAQTDLNGDGIAEFIVRNPENCKAEPLCLFGILADTDGKITDLGQIKARVLSLSDEYTQGIRNLIAFDSLNNDFAYTVYAWEPESSRYKMKE